MDYCKACGVTTDSELCDLCYNLGYRLCDACMRLANLGTEAPTIYVCDDCRGDDPPGQEPDYAELPF